MTTFSCSRRRWHDKLVLLEEKTCAPRGRPFVLCLIFELWCLLGLLTEEREALCMLMSRFLIGECWHWLTLYQSCLSILKHGLFLSQIIACFLFGQQTILLRTLCCWFFGQSDLNGLWARRLGRMLRHYSIWNHFSLAAIGAWYWLWGSRCLYRPRCSTWLLPSAAVPAKAAPDRHVNRHTIHRSC